MSPGWNNRPPGLVSPWLGLRNGRHVSDRPRILCVDDEARVLIGLSVLLRREFTVVAAESAAKAREIASRDGAFAVVLCGLAGGAAGELLAEFRERAPRTAGVLLVQKDDLDEALATINRGQPFRVLKKPFAAPEVVEALHAGVAEHARRAAEAAILDRTLVGTVGLLMDVLALTNPTAFGHVNQIRRHVTMLSTAIGYPSPWELEVASMLLQLGAVLLTPTTIEKLYHGEELNEAEARELAKGPQLVEELFRSVPRLDGVQQLVQCFQDARELVPAGTVALPTDRYVLGAGVLRIAQDFERLEWRGLDRMRVFELLHSKPRGYALELVDEFRKALAVRESLEIVEERMLRELLPGMVLVEDLVTRSGALIARKGHEINMSFVDGVRSNRFTDVAEPIRVVIGRRLDPTAWKASA